MSHQAGCPAPKKKVGNVTYAVITLDGKDHYCEAFRRPVSKREDMDLDRDRDVVTGVNGGRAIGLEIDGGDVLVLLNEGDAKSWTSMKLDDKGIYNGRVIDYDGDGDYDIFRLPHHGAERGYVFENLLYQPASSE